MKYTKEDFNYVWKDSTKESILNQFYYEHVLLHDYMNVCAEIKKMLTEDELIPRLDGKMCIKDARKISDMLNSLEGIKDEQR